MKLYILVWLFLGLTVYTHAQIITIRDKETNVPLEMVSLSSEGLKVSVWTNEMGQVDISSFRNAMNIQIELLGYKSIKKSFAELEAGRFEISLEPLMLSLDEVVVSATRWRQSSGNVPSKIISVGSKEVALQNPQTAADLLGISGKVFVQKSQQGGGSPMIRGFASNRLIYTVDGVRMNTAIFRGGNIQNIINLDPFAIEKTEVLFGPGSVIYGSDAIGGVMSFHSLKPQFSKNDQPLISGKAAIRYSSANEEKTGHFDVNLGWKKWSLVTSISSWDYNHLRQGNHGPGDYLKPEYVERQDGIDRIITQEDPLLQIPSAYAQMNIMQKIRFKPGENWDFEYGFHFSETTSYGRYDRHNRYLNGKLRYAEWGYGPQKWSMNHLNITHTSNNKLFQQMTVRLAQQSFEESRIERSLNNVNRFNTIDKVEAYSANIDFVKSIGDKNTLYYGIEYVFNDVIPRGSLTDISTNQNVKGPSRYPDATWSSLGIYVNDGYRLHQKLTVQGGLRYNQTTMKANFDNNVDFYPFPFVDATLNNGALTGSLGVVYRPESSWVMKANFGTAFRSPNVDDIGKIFDSEPGAITIPNPDLKAEYAYNFDLGFAKVFGDVVKLDVTGYYTLLQNALVRRNFQLNGQDSILYQGETSRVQAIQNAAIATVYGIQAGLEVKLPSRFAFSTDLNFQIGEEELDDASISPSRHAAPLFGVTRLSYEGKKLNVQLYAFYQGEKSYEDLPFEEQTKDEIYAKDSDGNNFAPAWMTLNFKAMSPITETFSISAGIENITDRRYRPFSSGLSGAGRNFVLSLNAKF